MSLFTELMGDAGCSLFDTNGETVTHVPREGEEAELTAVLGDSVTTERPAAGGQGKVKVTSRDVTIWNQVHPVYGGVVDLRIDGSFSIAGELWSIVSKPAGSGNFWKAKIEKTSQRFKVRDGAHA